MSDLHIDDFCKDSARILVALYAKFPQKLILYVEDIAGPDQPDEFGLHSPRHQACFSTMLWLAETDYISYIQPVRQEALEGATLTHRGFTFLASRDTTGPAYASDTENSLEPERTNSPEPGQIKNPETRIEKIRRELREGSSETLKKLMLEYFNSSRSFS